MNQEKEQIKVCLLAEDHNLQHVIKELSNTEKAIENKFKMGEINVQYLSEQNKMQDIYSKCYYYEHFILVLSNLSLTKQDSEKMKYGNNFVYIQMLQRLQAKQVYVMLSGEEFYYKQPADLDKLTKWVEEEIKDIWSGKNQNLNENEQNPLNLPFPQLVVDWKLHKQKMIEFFKPNLENVKKETVVSIIQQNKDKTTDLYILSGIIYKGITLYAQDGKFTIKSITQDKENKEYALAGQFVQVTFKIDVQKLQGIAYSHFDTRKLVKKLQLDVVFQETDEIPVVKRINKLKNIKLLYLGQEYDIQSINQLGQVENKILKAITNQQQQYIIYRIEITLSKSIYYYQSDKSIFLYHKEQKTLFFYGKTAKVYFESEIKYPQNGVRFVLLPKYKSNPSELMLYNQKDGRYLCRICKEANAYEILLECGHMRYCDDCCQLCIENKVCYYCDKEVKRMKRLNLEYVEEQEYQTFQQMNQEQIVDYFKQNQKQQPSCLQIINRCIEQNANFDNFLCQHCNKNLSIRYQYCEDQDFHFYLVCQQCSYPECPVCKKSMNMPMNIQYRFPDDPQIDEKQEKKEKKEKKEQQIKNNK